MLLFFGDVLEHLRNPWQILRDTKEILTEDGYVVASIPNIAHGAIRLALLQGEFEYTEFGILDNTHLRFFTRKTVEDLLENSGYLLKNLESTKLPFLANNNLVPQININNFDSEMIDRMQQDENIDTLQFVVRAVPCTVEERLADKQNNQSHNQNLRPVYDYQLSATFWLNYYFNDIDFCLKLISHGFRNVYLPHVVLYHYESKSRGYEDTPVKKARFAQEINYMRQKWSQICDRDPCYNPNLTKNHEDYRLKI